jgi:NADH-quinone oxidoreductase subunit J
MELINWNSFFFLLLAAVACSFAVAVVLAGNIVRMACYLVVSLTAVAGLFFLTGADFLGATQLMVYVGGTMVLLIFGVMLTSRGPFVSMKTGGGQWILALVVAGALLAILIQAAVSIPTWAGPRKQDAGSESVAAANSISPGATAGLSSSAGGIRGENTAGQASSGTQLSRVSISSKAAQLGLGLMGVRTDRLEQPNAIQRGGMSGYLLPFEIISIHLVVVLIGAAYLARSRRDVAAKPKNLADEETSRAIDYLLKTLP